MGSSPPGHLHHHFTPTSGVRVSAAGPLLRAGSGQSAEMGEPPFLLLEVIADGFRFPCVHALPLSVFSVAGLFLGGLFVLREHTLYLGERTEETAHFESLCVEMSVSHLSSWLLVWRGVEFGAWSQLPLEF